MLGTVWLVAAVVAVIVAWQGVAVVGDQVTDERPAPLAASDIEARLAEASTTTTAAPGSSTSTSTSTSTSSSTSTSTTIAAGDPSTPTSQTAPPATTPPPPPSTAPVAGETRTYNLHGGTASLRFSPAGVEVVFANPAPGFSVDVEAEHDNGVRVEFESETHESRVDGWWDGGPVDLVREDADD